MRILAGVFAEIKLLVASAGASSPPVASQEALGSAKLGVNVPLWFPLFRPLKGPFVTFVAELYPSLCVFEAS
jgi:hypothetical protein